MKRNLYFITTLFSFWILVQTNTKAQSVDLLSEITEKNSTQELMYFSQEKEVSVEKLNGKYKSHLSLTEQDALKLTQSHKSELSNWTHYRLNQYHQDIKVEGAQLLAHEKDNILQKANGHLVPNMQKQNIQASIDEAVAFQKALNFVNAQTYAWETAETTECPQAHLCWYDPAYSTNSDQYKLCYKFDIYAVKPLLGKSIFVNANTGEVEGTLELLYFQCQSPADNVLASGNSLYNGEVEFFTSFNADDNTYYLENCTGGGIVTKVCNNTYELISTAVSDTDNYWEADPTAVTLHAAVEEVYNVYKEVFGRASYDNDEGIIRSYAHYGPDFNNAIWYQNQIICGDGDGELYKPLVSLDIVAHEFTHGVTQYSSQLIYQNESGALNESFSDIFGVYIEYKTYGEGNWNWRIGEEAIMGYDGIRDLSKPDSENVPQKQPDTYLGNHWYNGVDNQEEVHTNSGVQNHWFYLLSEGGNNINPDFGGSFDIEGVGIDAAAQIAYLTLTEYLFPSANYVDMRNLSIEAAKELYGENSTAATACRQAWCAVGIGNCNDEEKSITITTPNGGEHFFPNDPIGIQWTSEGDIDKVKIELSTDGGINYSSLVSEYDNNGNFDWAAPSDINTTLGRIRISSTTELYVSDVSDTDFSIGPNIVSGDCNLNPSFELIDNGPYCQGTAYTVNTTGNFSEEASFEWHIGEEMISIEKNPNITFENAGIQSLSLTIIEGNCSATTAVSLDIVEEAMAVFTYSASELSVVFFANGDLEYIWDFGDGTQSTESNPVHTFETFDTYEVCLTVNNACSSNTQCQNITTVEEVVSSQDPCSNPTDFGNEEVTFYSNPNHQISAMLKNKDYIFTSGRGGLTKWNMNNGSYEKYTTKDGLYGTFNRSDDNIIVDANEDVWFLIENVLHKYNDATNTIEYFYSDENGNVDLGLVDISIGTDGTIWGINNSRLYSFDGINYTEIDTTTENLGIDIGEFEQLEIDEFNNIYIITSDGYTIRYNALANAYENIPNTITKQDANKRLAMAKLSDGTIWIGTRDEGIHFYNGVEFELLSTYPDSIGATNFYVDGSDVYFVRFEANNHEEEMMKYNGSTFESINIPFGYNGIEGITTNDEGDLYLALSNEDVSIVFHDGTASASSEETDNIDNWQQWSVDTPIPTTNPVNITRGPNGKIYLNFVWHNFNSSFDGNNSELLPFANSYWSVRWGVDANDNLYIFTYDSDGTQSLKLYDGNIVLDIVDLPNASEVYFQNTIIDVDYMNRINILGRDEETEDYLGIWRYDSGNFTQIITAAELPEPEEMISDPSGVLWMAAGESGLFKFTDDNGLEVVDLGLNSIKDLAIGDNGDLWIMEGDGKLYQYDGATLTNHDTFIEAQIGPVNSEDLIVASTGDIWIATGNTVIRYNPIMQTVIREYTREDGMSNPRDIMEDAAGNIWTDDWGGINRINVGTEITDTEGTVEIYTNPHRIVSMIKNKDYILTSSWGGVVKWNMNDGSYEKYTTKEGLFGNLNLDVDNMAVDANGDVWFITGGILHKYNDATNTIEYFYIGEEAGNTITISDISIGPDGTVWCIGWSSFLKFDGENFEALSENLDTIIETPTDTLTIDMLERLNQVHADENNNVWISTAKGYVIRYNPTNDTYENIPNSYSGLPDALRTTQLADFVELSDGTLWVGSYGGGIHQYNGASFEQVAAYPDSILATRFYVDGEDVYFVGSESAITNNNGNGIIKYDGTEFKHIHAPFWHGAVGGITTNEEGDLYLGVGGIVFYDGGVIADSLALNNQENWEQWETTPLVPSAYPSNIIGGGPNGQVYLDYIWQHRAASFDGNNFVEIIDFLEEFSGVVWQVDKNNNLHLITDKEIVDMSGQTIDRTQSLKRYDGNTLIDIADLPNASEVYFGNTYNIGIDIDNMGRVYIRGEKLDDESNEYEYEGVWRYDNGSVNQIITKEELNEFQLGRMESDAEGTLWIAARDSGLAKYTDANGLEFLNLPNLEYVSDIAVGDNGNIWIVKWDIELYEYDGTNLIEHYTALQAQIPEYDDLEVQDMLLSSTGDLWLTTQSTVIHYDPTSQTVINHYTREDGINTPTQIAEDSEGDIWTSGWGGINQIIFGTSNFANFSYNSEEPICVGSEVVFDNITQNAVNYTWLVNNTYISKQKNLRHSFTTAGQHIVTLIADNEDGCDNSYSLSVEVLPSASQFETLENIILCGNDSTVTLEAGTDQMAFYFWDFNGQLLGTDNTLTITEADSTGVPSGTYTVSMIDQCGGTAVKTFEVVTGEQACNAEPVWPGDINYDGVVDQYDILFFGSAYGNTGPFRPDASTEWTAQTGPGWAQAQMNGVNFKHADCNGDGKIDLYDPFAIEDNFGQTHTDTLGLVPINSEPIYSILANLVNERDTLLNGDLHSIKTINLDLKDAQDGSSATLPSYGFAGIIALEFSSELLEGLNPLVDVAINFNNSCLGNESENVYAYAEVDVENNLIYFGITRYDYQNVICGDGSDAASAVASIDIVVDDYLPFSENPDYNGEEVIEDTVTISLVDVLSINNGTGINELGNFFNIIAPVTGEENTEIIKFYEEPTNLEELIVEEVEQTFKVYPNPTTDYVKIELDEMIASKTKIELVNAAGQLVYQTNILEPGSNNTFQLDVSNLSEGVYTINITDNIHTRLTQKLTIIH